jgi:hypothetical protein
VFKGLLGLGFKIENSVSPSLRRAVRQSRYEFHGTAFQHLDRTVGAGSGDAYLALEDKNYARAEHNQKSRPEQRDGSWECAGRLAG